MNIPERSAQVFEKAKINPIPVRMKRINGSGYDSSRQEIILAECHLARWPESWPAIMAHELAHHHIRNIKSFVDLFGLIIAGILASAPFVFAINPMTSILAIFLLITNIAVWAKIFGWGEELICDMYARRWSDVNYQIEQFEICAKNYSRYSALSQIRSTHPPILLRLYFARRAKAKMLACR